MLYSYLFIPCNMAWNKVLWWGLFSLTICQGRFEVGQFIEL